MPNDAEIAQDPVVLSAEDAAAVAADVDSLPPPGDARRDELKRRADALRAAADRLENSVEIGAIDPSAFEVENEIGCYSQDGPDVGHVLDGSEIEDAEPGFVYHWEQADINNRHGNLWVTQAKAVGWVVVDGSMKEEQRRKFVDGTRRWGDTILMRMRRERYVELERIDRRRRIARKEGIALHVLEEAERKGILVHDLNSDKTPEYIRRFAQAQAAAGEAARATMVRTMRQAGRNGRVAAAELAAQRVDKALRAGTPLV